MLPKPKMEAPSPEPAEGERGLSNSERQSFTTCRKRWFWQYGRKYSPMTTPTPFLVGGAFHGVLAAFYSGEKLRSADVADLIAPEFDAVMKGEGAAFLSPEQLEDVEKQRTMAQGMCEAYLTVYAGDLKKWKVLEIEKKGHWQINNKWKMYFTIDLLIEKDDGIWVVEHKTTAAIDANYVSRLALDDQVSTYMVGVKRAWDIKPKGVIYNVVLKPRIRQKKDELRNEYLNRVLGLYRDSAAEYLYRESLLCSKRDLDGFEKELDLFTGEMDRAKEMEFYYRNTRACDNRGTCPYLPLCSEGEEQAKDRFTVRAERTQYEEGEPE